MKNIIKKYKHSWVFLYMIPYVLWYFGLQHFRQNVVFTDLYTYIDKIIPFVPLFIWPYIFWYLFVVGTVLYFFFKNVKDFYKITAFLFIGMTICLVIFTVFPTSFDHRPLYFQADPISSYFINSIYMADKCQNVFPSIHVYNSVGCAIAIYKCNDFKHGTLIKAFAIVTAILITLSTMFIKQHSILDVVSACILAIIMYIFVYRNKSEKN